MRQSKSPDTEQPISDRDCLVVECAAGKRPAPAAAHIIRRYIDLYPGDFKNSVRLQRIVSPAPAP